MSEDAVHSGSTPRNQLMAHLFTDAALLVHAAAEAFGAVMFFTNSMGMVPLPPNMFPPGPGLALLYSQSNHEGIFALRIASLAIFSTAILAALAWLGALNWTALLTDRTAAGPRPVAIPVLATLAFYHTAAVAICLMPMSAAAFDGDLGGLLVHGGLCVCVHTFDSGSPKRSFGLYITKQREEGR
jgi:hypothetical protein